MKGESIHTPAQSPQASSRLPSWATLRTAGSRTVALSLVMAAVGVFLYSRSLAWPDFGRHISLYWWALAPAVVCADSLHFHLEFRGEAHGFTLSEIPVVIGFFFAPVHVVLLCRIVGSTVFQIGRRRQFGIKLLFNVTDIAMDAGVILTLLHYLVAGRKPEEPVTWLLTILSVAIADMVMMLCVSTVIHWHGGRTRFRQIVPTTTVIAVVNTSLGLLAADLLWHSPAALVLLLVVLLVTFAAYRGYFNLTKRYASLQLLYDFTKAVSGSMRAEAVMSEILAKARQLLRAEIAEVILFDASTGRPTLRQRNTEDGDEHDPEAERTADLGLLWRQVSCHEVAAVVTRATRVKELQMLRDSLGVNDLVLAPL